MWRGRIPLLVPFLVGLLAVSMILFQAASQGSRGPFIEATKITQVSGTERVEFTEQSYMPAPRFLLVDEDPFNYNNWISFDFSGSIDRNRLYRTVSLSLMNITDLLVELRLRARNGPQNIELSFMNGTNTTSIESDQTQTVTLRVDAAYVSELQSAGVDSTDAHIAVIAQGGLFEKVDILSLKVWATSSALLVPVSFSLARSNNESFPERQCSGAWSDELSVRIWGRNPDGTHWRFWPWRSTDFVFLPPGNYTGRFQWDLYDYSSSPFNLTLPANHSIHCGFYVDTHKLSFVSDTGISGILLRVDAVFQSIKYPLADLPQVFIHPWTSVYIYIYIPSPRGTLAFPEIGPNVVLLANETSDITIALRLPVVVLGPVSISLPLLLFMAAIIGLLTVTGVRSLRSRPRNRNDWLRSRAGPSLLFILSLIVPWDFGQSLIFNGSSYDVAYWAFSPSTVTALQWASTGHLTVMPQPYLWLASWTSYADMRWTFVLPQLLWLFAALFLYLGRLDSREGWKAQLCMLSIATAAEFFLGVLFADYDILDALLMTGPLLASVSLAWGLIVLWKWSDTPVSQSGPT